MYRTFLLSRLLTSSLFIFLSLTETSLFAASLLQRSVNPITRSARFKLRSKSNLAATKDALGIKGKKGKAKLKKFLDKKVGNRRSVLRYLNAEYDSPELKEHACKVFREMALGGYKKIRRERPDHLHLNKVFEREPEKRTLWEKDFEIDIQDIFSKPKNLQKFKGYRFIVSDRTKYMARVCTTLNSCLGPKGSNNARFASAVLSDPVSKPIMIIDPEGEIILRSFLRLVITEDGQRALFMEDSYERSNQYVPRELDKAIEKAAIIYANQFYWPLYNHYINDFSSSLSSTYLLSLGKGDSLVPLRYSESIAERFFPPERSLVVYGKLISCSKERELGCPSTGTAACSAKILVFSF